MFLAERLDMTDTEVDFTTKNRYLLKQILQKKENVMNALLSFGDKDQKQPLINQIRLHYHQQLADLKAHCSLLEPPREDRTTPMKNNITAIEAEATATSIEALPETRGWTIAKTITATARLINPLPSSVRPLNQFIQKF